MGIGNLNPGCGCCEPPPGDGCTNCFNNESPNTWLVSFSDIADDACSGASILNTNWNVPLLGVATDCHWIYFLSDAEAAGLELRVAPCGCEAFIGGGGGDDVAIIVDVNDVGGGDYEIVVEIQFAWRGLHGCPIPGFPPTRSYFFRKTYTGEKPHCIELVDESIPFDSATADGYDASGATCLITAV